MYKHISFLKKKTGQAIVEYLLVSVITVMGVMGALTIMQSAFARGIYVQTEQIESMPF